MSLCISRSDFGKTVAGRQVELYTLSRCGLVAKLTTYGALLTELHVPDSRGRSGNVVLGFDTLAAYEQNCKPYLGATIGRVANRIGGASFTLDGVDYPLAANNGPNTLHGGKIGFDKAVWEAEALDNPAGPGVRFTYRSPHGEENFPGNLTATVTYTLTPERGIKIVYTAVSDQATPVNLTNHSYFNLAGARRGTIFDHVMRINADRYTPTDPQLIPTGQIQSVETTPLDFRSPTPIGLRIGQVPGGYDHNYALNGGGGSLAFAAEVREATSGRKMQVWTTEPGMQLYTGNFLDGPFIKHAAFCLETQAYPDALHHPNFPSIILRPGQTYSHVTIYQFS